MQYFVDGKINLSNLENPESFLIKLSNSLLILSSQSDYESFLLCSGFYHKNYYKVIKNTLTHKKMGVFFQKNAQESEFIYNLKHNMCKYGVYFFVENNDIFLKIYSGNGFLIDENLQNFLEKNLKNSFKKELKITKKLTFENFYEKEFLSKIKPFSLQIKCKNKDIKSKIKRYNLSDKKSNIFVEIDKDLCYEIYKKNGKEKVYLNKTNIFKNVGFLTDDELVREINLKGQKNVVSNKFLLYNKMTNFFDIFSTLAFLSKKI